MENLLHDHCLRVSASATREEFKAALDQFGWALGFDTTTATSVIDHADGSSDFISEGSMPPGYGEVFYDFEGNKSDPVMRHCKHHHVPIVWDQMTYVDVGCQHRWEQQAAFGYRCGIAAVMHLPAGMHVMVGIDRDKPLPKDAAEVSRMVASLQLFTVHAEEAARRLLAQRPADDVLPLSDRELEALRWTFAGKTAWEVGRIMGIAENTVIRHTQSAAQKLGCRGKHHAAMKALRLGLIG
ncbi:MAG: autoinducer binding domain-containing protein [Rhizobacter sp.]|nr:autoinducer binding domain-containing protein [Rhizobacter sp.]